NATYARYARPIGGDDTSEFQGRVNEAAATGEPLNLRRDGKYFVSTSLTFPSNLVLNANGAKIEALTNTNAPVITNSDRVNGNTGIIIRDLFVDARGSIQTSQINAIEFMRVSHSRFDNLDVTGAKRNQTFPGGTNGDGLCLIYSNYNEINGGNFHDNTYDGIKLRGSSFNKINAPTCDENGRSGIQLAFFSPTGPPFNVNEGIEAEGSNNNTILTPTIRHSTGTPHAYAPTTSGVYIHTGYRNTVLGIQATGVRQGIGVYAGANDNEFSGGFIAINHVDRAAIHIEGGPSGLFRNSFKGLTTRGISGANGKHVIVAGGLSGGGLNRFENCYFARGTGTGTWTVDVTAGVTDTWFTGCSNDGTLSDLGTNTVFSGPSLATGTLRHATPVTNAPVTTEPSGPISNQVTTFVDSTGRQCFKDSTGKVTRLGYGTITLPAGDPLPTADAMRRGQMRLIQGASGVADGLYLCRKKADDTYEWLLL
ncbi:right-handed parallel beta-helix repeat-containing protein, partial [Paenarthrobacter nicotinovorans]|uniref:right-handed parallel beta-helix repeat-containing protein n=1 Tax=Paenarthrobacter nicotinovorans TaxID=29320 RepID=UPI00382DAB53